MSMRNRRWTRCAGVILEVPVFEYLEQIAERENRDRSFCINVIVREHAARNGCPLPPATRPAAAESPAPGFAEMKPCR